jgi:uncharacterized membrane protein YqaE (UPF0057 family)
MHKLITMKKNIVHFMGIALCGLLLLSSCATGNRYSKVSYGGAWKDAAAQPTTSSLPEKSTEVQSPAAIESTPVAMETPTSANSVSAVTKTDVATDKTAKEVKASKQKKASFKQKVAHRVAHKIAVKASSNEIDNKVVLVIIAIFLPWLAVLLYEGEITLNFWLTLLLWFLFFIPGFIYALLVIFDVI